MRVAWRVGAGFGGLALAVGLVLASFSPSFARPAQRTGAPLAATVPDCSGGPADAAGGVGRWSDAGVLSLADGRRLVPEGIALPTRLWPDRRMLALAGEPEAAKQAKSILDL